MFAPQVPVVSVADLPDAAFLLDVREDEEWAAGHAPGAVACRPGLAPVVP